MFNHTVFFKSAAQWKDLPPEGGKEIAFWGRSNSGKSSTLNSLCHQRVLARTSRTPGRTTLLNYFEVGPQRWFVDLPGYGYARTSKREQEAWNLFVSQYLQQRHSLVGLILIMDIRHPLTPLDEHVLSWLKPINIPTHILLNKADKIGYGAQQQTLQSVEKNLRKINPQITTQTFSAHSQLNLQLLEDKIQTWLS